MARKLFLLLTVLVVQGISSETRGDEPVLEASYLGVPAKFAAMQAELDALQVQVQQISLLGGDAKGACGHCGSVGCACYCDVGCGAYAGFELAVLKPFFEQGNKLEAGVTPTNADLDYFATPRVFGGWRGCEGLGWRVRAWTFDQQAQLQDPASPDVWLHAIDATAVDLEATQLVCWGPLQMNLAGGVRYGKFEHNSATVDVAGNDFDAVTGDFEGIGPTLAVEFRRPLPRRSVSLVGNLRTWLLYGETKAQTIAATVNLDNFRDRLSPGVASQFGLEYNRCRARGALKVRALVEAQYWDDISIIEIDEAGTERISDQGQDGVGFLGATIGFEYAR